MNNKVPISTNTYSFLKTLVNFCFKNEGKFLVNTAGEILIANTENIELNLAKGQNLVEFINAQLELESDRLSLVDLLSNSDGYDKAFSTAGGKLDFRVLIIPFLNIDSPLYLVQILDRTLEKNDNKKISSQQKRVEDEMLLRTQEIMMTNEALSDQGGFLMNFLRGLRHDLISPITQLKEIINYYKSATDSKKKEKAAELIDHSLVKLSKTAQGLSDFVDLHLASEIEDEAIVFQEIHNEACSFLNAEITDTSAKVICDFSKVEKIVFNKKLLESIYYNLLSNAIKFKSDQRPLVISVLTYKEGKFIILEMEDNGIGIDLEENPGRLFKPFERLNMDRPGAGVGLSLVKNILSKSSGIIKVKSKLDVGTSVRISFLNKTSFPDMSST